MDYRQQALGIFDFDILHLQLNTPIFILVLTLVVMYLLNRLLFRPVIRTLDNRETLLTELRERAEANKAETERLAENYQRDLERVRGEVAQVRAEAQREAQQQVNTILGQARQEANAEFDAAMAELNGEIETAKASLDEQAQRLAQSATTRILGA